MQSSAENSIPDLSHSSAQSTSPVGDFPEHVSLYIESFNVDVLDP